MWYTQLLHPYERGSSPGDARQEKIGCIQAWALAPCICWISRWQCCWAPYSQSGKWRLVSTHLCPQFWRSKKNSNSIQFIELYSGVSEQINLYNTLVSRQSSSLSPSWSPCLSSGIDWQSLPKAIPEDNQSFWLQKLFPSSWGRAPAQLGRVGQASANTGYFQVGSSSCWQLPARLMKTCYHSCDTDSVHNSKCFNAL